MPRRRPRAQPKTSSTQVAVAVGGAVLFVLGIAVLQPWKSGSEPAPAPVANKPTDKPPPRSRDMIRRDEAREWYRKTFLDDYESPRRLEGAEVQRLIEEGERLYGQVPKLEWKQMKRRVYKSLLRREPYHPGANREFGKFPLHDYPGFFRLFEKMRGHAALPEEFEAFLSRYDEKIQTRPYRAGPPLTKDEYNEAAALLDRFKKWDREMAGDATGRAIFTALRRVKSDPLLGGYETVHIVVHPFVLFYASRTLKPRDDSDFEKGRVQRERERLTQRLESFRKLIESLLAYSRKQWIEPLKLPAFEPEALRFVWVFGDRTTFDKYQKKRFGYAPPFTLGFFSFQTFWTFLYEDPKQRIAVESTLAHELTHHLHWHFSRDDKNKQFMNHFVRTKAIWFKEGWAEYVGGVEKTAGGYKFAQLNKHRLKELAEGRRRKLPLYPLRLLVQAESYRDWNIQVLTWVEKKKIDLQKHGLFYISALYAQSWLLMHFLHEYDGGKYRQNVIDFTKASLKGYEGYRGARGYARGHEVFAQVFNLKTLDDWARFQKEFDDYARAVITAHAR